MRRFLLLLSISPLLLTARAGAAQATTVRSIEGNDQRGKYEISWVRLADGAADAAVRRRVNADLEREAKSHACDPEPDPERRRDLEAWYEMEVTYRSPRLLGIRTLMELWCGGASPSSGPGALLYDLRTGRRIELEEEMADPGAFRRFVARRALAAAPSEPAECVELYTLEQLAGTSYVYTLNARGLTASQSYPRVINACGYDTEIPYADVVRFVKPGSPLKSLASAVRTRNP
jgi:hypothetical protein